MTDYDYIIAGGGCAGLSLAYHLDYHGLLKGKTLLIIDRERKHQNDRTWCFWTAENTLFDHIVYRSWQQLEILSDHYAQVHPLQRMLYKIIRGIDFYKEANRQLEKNPNVHFLNAEVTAVEDNKSEAAVRTASSRFTARYVFDSRFDPGKYTHDAPDYHYLVQHFKGWVIKTTEPCFNPSTVTLFDFRTPQHNDVRFFYTLPFENDLALVEYTIFSRQLLKDRKEYEVRLKDYVENVLKIKNYQIEEEEFGAIPMTDYRFTVRESRHVMNIGTLGGQSKPSTGYTFLRIQRDSAAIVKALQETGAPFYKKKFNRQFETYDSMILNIMHREGGSIKGIFTQMFQNNPMERVLSFLDEQTSFVEDLQIMASVPPFPFLKSIGNIFLPGKLRKD